MSSCPVCNAPVAQSDGRGRPQKFCSPVCRKTASLEIRRISGLLSRLEEWSSHARLCGRRSTVWKPPEVYQAEIDFQKGRLRELLGDD